VPPLRGKSSGFPGLPRSFSNPSPSCARGPRHHPPELGAPLADPAHRRRDRRHLQGYPHRNICKHNVECIFQPASNHMPLTESTASKPCKTTGYIDHRISHEGRVPYDEHWKFRSAAPSRLRAGTCRRPGLRRVGGHRMHCDESARLRTAYSDCLYRYAEAILALFRAVGKPHFSQRYKRCEQARLSCECARITLEYYHRTKVPEWSLVRE
jgi:hypothetical protein